MRLACLALLLLLAAPVQAQTADWQRAARLEDRARVELIPAILAAALAPRPADAYSGITAEELAQVLTRPALPVDARTLPGEWRCRGIQGSTLGVFAYSYFRCRIVAAGATLKFEKLTGSQRKSGQLYPDGPERMVMLGGSTVNQEPQRGYAATGSEERLAANAVGILTRTGPDAALMVFPEEGEAYELYEMRRAPAR